MQEKVSKGVKNKIKMHVRSWCMMGCLAGRSQSVSVGEDGIKVEARIPKRESLKCVEQGFRCGRKGSKRVGRWMGALRRVKSVGKRL